MRVFVAAILIALSAEFFAQQKIPTDSIAKKMEWFADAKLCIFIHYGIYAVNGIDESWSFYNKKIGYWDYMKQLNEKMITWSLQDISVFFNDQGTYRWGQANDQNWLALLNNGLKHPLP